MLPTMGGQTGLNLAKSLAEVRALCLQIGFQVKVYGSGTLSTSACRTYSLHV